MVHGERQPYTAGVLDIPQATVARAIDILRRHGPLRAAAFARLMWPERCVNRTEGQCSQMGSPFLRQLAQVGYVQRIADIWTLRAVGTADRVGDSAVQTADAGAVGVPNGPPLGVPVGPLLGEPDPMAERERLRRLVQLADAPVATVVHDRVLGDLAIERGPIAFVLDGCLAEGCAYVVLLGATRNVYLPGEEMEMLVGLTPVEAARALHLRWAQSGQPPELLNVQAWIFLDDGIALTGWRPADADENWFDPEPLDERVHRQRELAGLG